MKATDQSRARRVTKPGEVAALDHPLRARLLMACVRREKSLTELAGELDQPLGKLHYHLGRLMRCGLLAVARTLKRPGRPIRYYRADAKSFLISLADMAEAPSDKLARALHQSLAREHNRRNLSLLYDLDEAGRYRVRLTDPDGGGRDARTFEQWRVLRLSDPKRRALAAELRALLSRYEAGREGSGGEPFLIYAAFAPKIGEA